MYYTFAFAAFCVLCRNALSTQVCKLGRNDQFISSQALDDKDQI